MTTLYDRIGATYSRSRRADPEIARTLADELRLVDGGAYLDLACGTGSYTNSLSTLGGVWSAIDVSEVMLAQAKKRSSAFVLAQASADALPFKDASFDGVVCTLGIHHFADLDLPFSEVRRTLRSGVFVFFTGLAEQMRNYWLCHYFPEMMARSTEKMPAKEKIYSALSRAGFKSILCTPFHVTDELQDLFLYSGKHRPHLYLDPEVRANISSFASLATAAELQEGLARLAADLQSGAFASVKARYATHEGDYAFISAHVDA
jgi:ubiquinone/menaquinone biosynthesis C-methylase UbiE